MNYSLPSNKTELARVIRQHVAREQARKDYHKLMWYLCWHYLNGCREFRNYNAVTNRYESFFVDEHGKLEFASQTLLSELDRVVARLNTLDTMPQVGTNDRSLERQRERAAAQILLDNVVQEDQVAKARRDFNFMLCAYGMAGLQGHLSDHPTIGISADIEAIHPRELLPFPSLGYDHTKACGLIRHRVYTLEWLRARGIKITPEMLNNMDWYEVQVGDREMVEGYEDIRPEISYNHNRGSGPGEPTKNMVGVARITQLWLDGPKGTCSRYVVTCGDVTLVDKDLSQEEHYCPISYRRFMENGSWYGCGMFSLLYGIHRQMELMLKSTFNNARDNDRFGVLVLPAGAFNERNLLHNTQEGLRVMTYTPDPIVPEAKPFAISPVNSGELPAATAEMASQVLQSLSPVRDLAEEKGRLDSAMALQYLDEQINRGMTNPTMAVEGAWADMYRSLCSRTANQVTISPKTLPITRISLDLAGVVVDPRNNTVRFPMNPLSDVSRLKFSIQENYTGTAAARKMEAIQHFNEARTDPDGFKIYCLREGIEVAMDLSEERASLEMAELNALILYADGQSPGEIVVSPFMTRPDFQLRVITGFMNSTQMAMASVDVQDAFADWIEFLQSMLGAIPMAGAPNPDDLMAMAIGTPAPEGEDGTSQQGSSPSSSTKKGSK